MAFEMRYIECFDLATLRPRYVQDTRPKIDMLGPCLPDCFGAMARKQHEQMELPPDRVLQSSELGEPPFQIRQAKCCVAPVFGIPVYG